MIDKGTIAFDLDGTLCSIEGALAAFNNETGKHITYTGMYDYAFKKVYDLSVKQEVAIWDKHMESIILDSAINKKLVDYLKTRHKQGYTIIIVTAREQRYMKVTAQWLNKHSIPYDKLYMSELDKYQPLKDNNVIRFFDDKGSLMEDLMKTDLSETCELTIIDSTYNQNFKAHSRFYV